MIKVEKVAVEFEGSGSDLLAECAFGLSALAREVSNGDAEIAEASIYSTVLATARILREVHGIDVDTLIIGNQIANATKE